MCQNHTQKSYVPNMAETTQQKARKHACTNDSAHTHTHTHADPGRLLVSKSKLPWRPCGCVWPCTLALASLRFGLGIFRDLLSCKHLNVQCLAYYACIRTSALALGHLQTHNRGCRRLELLAQLQTKRTASQLNHLPLFF